MASEYRLGTVQAAQFQSGDQYGANWKWGSRCAEAGGTCSETLTNNALAEMPRSYSDSNNTYYAYYAFAAESAGYNDLGSTTMSICPSGWKLPQHSGTGSWNKIVNDYSLSDTKTSAEHLSQAPFLIVNSSLYGWDSGQVQDLGKRTYLATSRKSTKAIMNYLYTSIVGIGSYLNVTAGGNTMNGVTVRCVQLVPTS